jgi:hypothetical protein
MLPDSEVGESEPVGEEGEGLGSGAIAEYSLLVE